MNSTLPMDGEWQPPAACAAIIVAAGQGRRFGGDIPKQYRSLVGHPVLRRTVDAFLRAGNISNLVVVINPANRDLTTMTLDGVDWGGCRLAIVDGADDRQGSVRAGLEYLAGTIPSESVVLIHDGVRPLVQADTVRNLADLLQRDSSLDGAIAALPVTDTLKARANDGLTIGRTLDRTGLYRALTPQAFRFRLILDAHRQATGQSLTDDAAVAEWAGLTVGLVEDSPDNIKITTAADLETATALLRQTNGIESNLDQVSSENRPSCRKGQRIRIGQGFDVHRLVAGDGLTLCGVWIPGPYALTGHSDADVGLHALTDAILGALADGDIGFHFPPTDTRWKGADSSIFLDFALSRIRQRDGRLSQIDLTLICEEPKIGPVRGELRSRLATMIGLDQGDISVKATTTERLGFPGRGEGIAALAMVVLEEMR